MPQVLARVPQAGSSTSRRAHANLPRAADPSARGARGAPVLRGAAWATLVLAVVVCLRELVSPVVAVALVGLACWFTMPGAVVVWRSYEHHRHAGWLLAPTFGFIGSSLATLALWALGARGLWVVLAAPLIAAACAAVVGGAMRGLLAPPAFTRRDALALPLVLLLVPATVGLPFAHVGDVPPGRTGGEAYRAYFTADVVWAMAAVSEVSKGDFLPRNPFRLGSSLHYYWLAHLFPAIEHRAMPVVPLRSLLLANAVMSGLAFVAFLYLLARHFTTRASAAGLGVVFAVWATSFEGLQYIIEIVRGGHPWSLLRQMNIDALTRWQYHGMPVDGLQRVLFYQPQHQVGYASGFAALLLVLQARRVSHLRLGAVAGLTLAGSFLLSTFSAFMLTVIVGITLGWRMLREGAWKMAVPVAMAAAVPLLGAVWLGDTLEYVEHGSGSLVSVVRNALAFHDWPFALWLSMGPVVVVGTVWLLLARRVNDDGASPLWPLAVVVAVSLGFYFFVDVRDHEHVYVGWRSGHLIFIAFAGIAAATIDRLATAARAPRLFAAAAMGLVGACALPTTAIDIFNTQDIANFDLASTFHWTVWLSPDEVAGLAWVREHTPPSTVVQMDTRGHGTETWAYIPAFAERRMSAGLPISMIPLSHYMAANARVVQIFDAQRADDLADGMRRNGIDLLWLGPHEQAHDPRLLGIVASRPDRCGIPFSNATVSVVSCR